MPDADDLESLDFIKIPHYFEVDLNSAVMLGHRFALEAIDRAENEDTSRELSQEDHESVGDAISRVQRDYDELRNAANQLALVGVVTRFGHEIEEFVKRLPAKKELPPKLGKGTGGGLVRQLNQLNGRLGDGPVPLLFFKNLVDVRDSIIHADSQAKWSYERRDRKIADCYRNPYGRVELSKEQVEEAASKAIEQVSWYTGKL